MGHSFHGLIYKTQVYVYCLMGKKRFIMDESWFVVDLEWINRGLLWLLIANVS